MSEKDEAIRVARIVLDSQRRDPDDHLSMMSRQFLRALEPREWQPIEMAAQHVKDAASVTFAELGRSRIRIYYGPKSELHAFLIEGPAGSTPTKWIRLPDFPPS